MDVREPDQLSRQDLTVGDIVDPTVVNATRVEPEVIVAEKVSRIVQVFLKLLLTEDITPVSNAPVVSVQALKYLK